MISFNFHHLFFVPLLNPFLANMDFVVRADEFQNVVWSVFVFFVII